MKNLDILLENHLQNDKLSSQPSDALFSSLHNHMLAKSASSQTKQNSFFPPFTSIIGKKNIAIKISIAAVLLISFMGIKQMNHSNLYIQTADSTQVQHQLDTLNFQLVDSSLNY